MEAGRRGIATVLIDARQPGAGAAAGLLGALMPHMPDRWSEKKQFQFDALSSLEARIARLEADTGLSAGYRRTGRLIPLPKPHLRTIALGHSQDAGRSWKQQGRDFHWHVLETSPDSGWIDPAAAQAGSSTIRLPRAYRHAGWCGCSSKRCAVARRAAAGGGRGGRDRTGPGAATSARRERDRLWALHPGGGGSVLPMLQTVTPPLPVPLGQPVKGQAAVLAADVDPRLPVIFRDGLYIVAHEGGHVAVGSTSENTFADPFGTDAQLDALIAAARALSPALADAPVIERWAGLRPKAIDRDPMVGPHPDHPAILALTGGFKVSFGLAHALADAVLDHVEGKAMTVPASFLLGSHIAVAARSA